MYEAIEVAFEIVLLHLHFPVFDSLYLFCLILWHDDARKHWQLLPHTADASREATKNGRAVLWKLIAAKGHSI